MSLELKVIYEDLEFFRLEDTKQYTASGLTTLSITPPGFDEVIIPAFTNFTEDISTDVLQITASGRTYLPEGLYGITYETDDDSVCYKYLNNTQQYKKYIEAICSLYSQKCNMKIQDWEKSRNELYVLGRKIKDAKYLCEDCGKTDIGMDLFREINLELSNFKPCYNGCSSC